MQVFGNLPHAPLAVVHLDNRGVKRPWAPAALISINYDVEVTREGPIANRIATVGFPRALPSLARAPSYEWPDIFFQERPSPIAWLPPGKLTHRSRAGACHAGGERTTGGAHQFWGCSRSPLLPLQAGLTCLWKSLRRAYVPIAASGASSASKDLDPIRRSVLAAGAPFFRSPTVRMPAVTARSAHRRAAFQNISRCRAQQKRSGRTTPARRELLATPQATRLHRH